MKTEVEQLLYYSVPGFFVEFLVVLYLLLVGKTEFISTAMTAILVVAAIPIGYIVYQAYTSSGFYDRVWKRWYSGRDSNFEFIAKMIDERTAELSPELRKEVKDSISSPYLFNSLAFLTQNVETVEYSWRLVNLINGRAVAIFSCLLVATIPIGYSIYYVITPYFPQIPKPDIEIQQLLSALVLYYLVLVIIIFILHRRISHIKQRLVCFNQGIIISSLEKLEETVWAFISFNTVSKVEKLLVSKKALTNSTRRLLKEAYEKLKAKNWEEAFKMAKEVYQTISEKESQHVKKGCSEGINKEKGESEELKQGRAFILAATIGILGNFLVTFIIKVIETTGFMKWLWSALFVFTFMITMNQLKIGVKLFEIPIRRISIIEIGFLVFYLAWSLISYLFGL